VLVLLLASVGLLPLAAQACAVCYGESDAPMSRGLTWAVVVLGGMITVVLVGVAGFFVHVSRRTKASAPATAQIDSGS
jgi:hypothetical protein